MPISFNDLLEAYHFVSMGGLGEHQAYLSRQSGKLYWHSDICDEFDELPDDLAENEDYVQIPDKRELDLGKPLVLNFASEFMADDFDHVRQIFSKRGAYARFKDLLIHRRMLDQWHAFEAKAEERALREWCALNSIELEG
jgi:hypothetical protein